MRTGEHHAAYFAEATIGDGPIPSPGIKERSRLAEEETFQLERSIGLEFPDKPRGEARKFFRAFREEVVERLGSYIAEADSERKVQLFTWADLKAQWDTIAAPLGRGQLYAYFVGIGQVDRILTTNAKFSDLCERYVAQFDEPLLNDDALQALSRKVPLTEEEVKALEAKYRATAFTIAKVTSADLIESIKLDLVSHLAKGDTFADWRNQIDDLFIAKGFGRLDSRYLETVYRTNVASAYQVGRWESAQRNAPLIKLLEYHAILDERTRPNHRAMHEFRAPIDSYVWKEWYPPNGYRCRCTVVFITPQMVRVYDLAPSTAMPDLHPDKGFEFHPAQGLPPEYLSRAERYGIRS